MQNQPHCRNRENECRRRPMLPPKFGEQATDNSSKGACTSTLFPGLRRRPASPSARSPFGKLPGYCPVCTGESRGLPVRRLLYQSCQAANGVRATTATVKPRCLRPTQNKATNPNAATVTRTITRVYRPRSRETRMRSRRPQRLPLVGIEASSAGQRSREGCKGRRRTSSDYKSSKNCMWQKAGSPRTLLSPKVKLLHKNEE